MGLLAMGNFFVWYAVSAETRGGVLTVSFLDVGQGDAIFIDSPSGIQVLIDGGKGKKVLSELGKVMPFYDHSIDVVIATHPDQDHMEGLVEVIRRYKTLVYIVPNLITDKPFQISLGQEVKERGVRELHAMAGQKIELGMGARLTILFPDQDVSKWQSDTNMASVIALLEYGKTKFLFTGDSPSGIEEYLTGKLGSRLDVNVLKAGHHGSRTSSSPYFLSAVSPETTIISAGRENSYGHPHKEVLDNLAAAGSQVLSTADVGQIALQSDGQTILRKD